MGLMLVAHALANAAYDDHAAYFRAFVRRYGFPVAAAAGPRAPARRDRSRLGVGRPTRRSPRCAASCRRLQIERLERLLHG
jgi:hypothetical protein